MALIKCSECGRDVSDKAIMCPKCGAAIVENKPLVTQVVSVTTSDSTKRKNLKGLAGWLILLRILLICHPFYILYVIFSVNLPLFYNSNYQSFIAKYPTAGSLGIYELLINIVFLAALIYLNVLFYKKKKTFPPYYIIYLIVNYVLVQIDYLILVTKLPSMVATFSSISSPYLIRGAIYALIWILYLLISRRVKATFVQ